VVAQHVVGPEWIGDLRIIHPSRYSTDREVYAGCKDESGWNWDMS
jgi:hypothetical protein